MGRGGVALKFRNSPGASSRLVGAQLQSPAQWRFGGSNHAVARVPGVTDEVTTGETRLADLSSSSSWG
jgi:hypothetical protein